eukprot:s157_g17.t1
MNLSKRITMSSIRVWPDLANMPGVDAAPTPQAPNEEEEDLEEPQMSACFAEDDVSEGSPAEAMGSADKPLAEEAGTEAMEAEEAAEAAEMPADSSEADVEDEAEKDEKDDQVIPPSVGTTWSEDVRQGSSSEVPLGQPDPASGETPEATDTQKLMEAMDAEAETPAEAPGEAAMTAMEVEADKEEEEKEDEKEEKVGMEVEVEKDEEEWVNIPGAPQELTPAMPSDVDEEPEECIDDTLQLLLEISEQEPGTKQHVFADAVAEKPPVEEELPQEPEPKAEAPTEPEIFVEADPQSPAKAPPAAAQVRSPARTPDPSLRALGYLQIGTTSRSPAKVSAAMALMQNAPSFRALGPSDGRGTHGIQRRHGRRVAGGSWMKSGVQVGSAFVVQHAISTLRRTNRRGDRHRFSITARRATATPTFTANDVVVVYDRNSKVAGEVVVAVEKDSAMAPKKVDYAVLPSSDASSLTELARQRGLTEKEMKRLTRTHSASAVLPSGALIQRCSASLALFGLARWLKQPKAKLLPSLKLRHCPATMDAMDAMDPLDLEWMEHRPRGWSMQRGHRRRLMVAHGDDVRCRGRSTVKRTVASGKRWQLLEKNKSHKQQVRLWWEMRSDVVDHGMIEEDCYDWVSEDELDLASVDDWEISSVADTASTAASTVEVVPCTKGGAKGGAKAWELALEQAAVVAKRLGSKAPRPANFCQTGRGLARVAMSLFGSWSHLTQFQTVTDLRHHFGVPDPVWQAFATTVGDVRDDIRVLAAFPRTGLTAACTQAQLPDGSPLNPVQATQIGLVWRLARRVVSQAAGMAETEFQDIDPWGEPPPVDSSRQGSSSTGVKEKILKMSALIDQSDDSELLPPGSLEVNTWLQNYHAVMGSMPEESEEPSPNQLAALSKRIFRDDAPPYVDFAVFGPYERKLTKSQKCRIFTPLGDGTYLQRDLPGPPTYQGWLASWRVLKTALIMLDAASLAALETYGKHVERLVTQWPSAWGLIYSAEDSARAERMAKLRRHYAVESSLGRQVPRDWNPRSPWSCIFIQLTKDDAYWAEKVHVPASAWVAAGSRGQPVVATEAAVKAHVPGLQDTIPEGHDADDDRRRQSRKDKKQARKRKIQQDLEELRSIRQNQNRGNGGNRDASGGKASGGKGKSKSKDQSGAPLCFAWAAGTGACGKLPPGAECVAAIKRIHKCRKCLSPSHRDADCPN